ncbi:DUF11 domain-containing protein [Paenibacillus psychroresistens]|uniref:DUF11 domain-containing protein n=1 Tax=Paenibacillus psychroresistens TaxID=1778678 RepID=A0A6B8RKS0_9BACL|nr:S-layer homology domain-containing protein [Paenibacillus psychroresistens]QGQ95958.1 DUF11 domain-containing protein [Paenibacillus psychroresistens]
MMKKKLSVIMIFMLLFQFVSGIFATSVGATINPNTSTGITVFTHVYGETVLGRDSIVYVTTKNESAAWAFNVGIEVVLDDGLQISDSQAPAPTSKTGNSLEKQTAYWQDIKDLAPGESFEFPVKVNSLEKYRILSSKGYVPFKAVPEFVVNVHASKFPRILNDPPNEVSATTTQILKIMPFSIIVTNPSKQLKGASGSVEVQSSHPSEWGAGNYEYNIVNNTRFETKFNSLTSLLGGSLEAYNFTDTQPTTVNKMETNNKRSSQWVNLYVPENSDKSLKFKAAFLNNDTVDSDTDNDGAILTHGATVSNTIQYNATVDNINFISNADIPSANIEYNSTPMDIIIDKSVIQTSTHYADTLEYTLTITTNEYYQADTVVVTDIIGDGQSFGSYVLQTGLIDATNPAPAPNPVAAKASDGTTTFTWNIGTMLPKKSVTLHYTTTVDNTWAGAPYAPNSIYAGDNIHNWSKVTAHTVPSGIVSDSDSTSVPIAVPKITEEITSVADAAFVTPITSELAKATVGDKVNFRITYDASNVDAKQHEVVVYDYLPLGTLPDNAAVLAGNGEDDVADLVGLDLNLVKPEYIADLHALVWTLDDVDELMTLSVDVPVVVIDATDYVKLDKSEQNLVVLSYKNSPGRIKSERDTVKLQYVEPYIELSRKINTTIVDSSSVTVNGGQSVLVSVYLTNNSTTSTAFNVKFIDTLPPELENPSSVSDGSTPNLNNIAFNEIPSIAPGQTITFSYRATVINPIGVSKEISESSKWDYYSQSGHKGRHYIDPTDPSNITRETLHVTMKTEDVAITKTVVDSTSPTFGDSDVQVGDKVVYKIIVTVPKNEVMYDAFITDDIPAGQTLLNVYAVNQYIPSSHSGTPLSNTTYSQSGAANTSEIVRIPQYGASLPQTLGVSASTPTYTYFIETKVVRITDDSDQETQKSKAQIHWKDQISGGDPRSKESSNAQVIVSKPNLKATITPLNADMEKGETQTIIFKLENIGTSEAYDFVPTIKLPAGFKVADLASTSPLLEDSDVSGNIDDGFTLTYDIQNLAKAASTTFSFPLMLEQVKGSGSSHHVNGASGVYYSTHSAFVNNSTDENEKFPTAPASSTIKVPGLQLTNKIIGTSNGISPGDLTQIRPGDLLDYELEVIIPDGTNAYNLIVEDTLPSLEKFDLIGTDLDGSTQTVSSTTYKYTFIGEIDASGSEKKKTIVLHLRAKTDGSFANDTENATSSATAKWETALSGGNLLTTSPEKTNTIAVIRPILSISATPVIGNPQFASNNKTINIQYLLTNTGAGKAYGTNVEVPILPGLSVVESTIKSAGTASGSLIEATGGSGGKVVWNNLTVNGNNSTLVLSFDVELSANSPVQGAGITELDLIAALKQYKSIATISGDQHAKTYMPNEHATHTLTVAPLTLDVTVTANTYMPGNTTKVRPGDQLTYRIDLNTTDNSTVYHPILNLTGLVDQVIISVKQGNTTIPLTENIGYILSVPVIGDSPISDDSKLTVVTRVNTNTNYSNPHDTSFKPTISYKTADTNDSDKLATVSQLVQTVVEPVLTLEITQDKPDLSTPGEEVTYTVTVGNASGNSDAFNANLDLSVSSKIYLSHVALAEVNDIVTSNSGPTGNGTIHWIIGSIPKGNSAILKFKAAAKDATTVTTAIYGEAKLKEYYSIPGSVLPGDGGKKYTSLLTNTATGVVKGTHALDLTHTYSITAGKSQEFPHTLKNNGAGRDTFTLSLQNGIYPTDLFAGTDMVNPIAKGKLDEGVWKWEILNLGYSSNGNSTGEIVVDLAAGAIITLKLVVNVPVTTQYDNLANTTVLQAVSKYHISPISVESVNDTLTVTGTPLDGWVGNQLPLGPLAPRIHNPATSNDWMLPVFGQYDSMTLQAVSAVNVKAVVAIYTVNSEVVETKLTLVNPNFVDVGYKQWTGVSRLPFSITTGTYGTIYKAYDAVAVPRVELETDTYNDEALSVGGNNKFKLRQSLTVEGTITDLSTHNNLAGAKVVLYDPLNKVVVATLLETTSNGHYSFSNINVGEYELLVIKSGYSQTTKRFYALPEDDTSNTVIVDAALSPYKITMTANPSTILGDGVSQSILTAIVSDNEGNALDGVTVTFTAPKGTFSSTSNGTFVAASISAITDEHGIAHVQFKSDIIAGTASVRFPVNADVSDPINNLYANGQIIVTFDPGAIVGIVTETLKDESGNLISKPVKGAIVTVSKKEGNEVIFSATMTTAENGAYKIAIPVGNTDYDVVITKPILVGTQTKMVDFPQVAHAGAIIAGIYKEFPAEKTGSGLLIFKTQSGEETLLEVALAQRIQGYLIKVIDPSLPQEVPIPVTINDNGTFNAPNLDPGTYQFAITYKDENAHELILGSKLPTIVIGNNGALIGEMNIALGLIDPYGTVTDIDTGLPIAGAHVTLFYANTPRNLANVTTPPVGQTESPIPGTLVHVPQILSFAPFDNLSPEQITLIDGQYAWMVYDHTDYYVETTKPGYYSNTSGTLSVDGAIVKYDPKLKRIPSPAAQQEDAVAPVAPIVQTQADLAVQLLSDNAAYPEEGIVTFTINYLNKSDVIVKGVTVKAQIPQYTDILEAADGKVTGSEITWKIGDLAPKASGTIVYKVKVKANSLPQAEVKVTNEATIASTDTLVNLEDDKSPLSILLFTSRFGDQGHERYIKGYPDGNFKPNRAITRAEIAAIFSRIMDLQSTVTGEKFYTDITATFWAKEYIETATRVGLFTGYENGGFRPDAPITRAELSTVIFRYLKLTDRAPIKLDFTDIETHWAKNAIEEIFRYHIITGYPDKTFRPGADMIRTEAVTMINRLLNRGPLYGAEVSFPDVNATHWAFGQVEESAITHEYKRFDNGSEQMTKYIPEPLW